MLAAASAVSGTFRRKPRTAIAVSRACPIVASFGTRDPLGIGAANRLRKVTAAKNIPADIKSYPGAGHSFANKLPGQPLVRIAGFGYNEAATEDAWRRVFEFFGQHLRAGSPGEP